MKINSMDVVDSDWQNNTFSRDTIGWSIELNFGKSGRFVGRKVYKSIDGAYKAMDRLQKKIDEGNTTQQILEDVCSGCEDDGCLDCN